MQFRHQLYLTCAGTLTDDMAQLYEMNTNSNSNASTGVRKGEWEGAASGSDSTTTTCDSAGENINGAETTLATRDIPIGQGVLNTTETDAVGKKEEGVAVPSTPPRAPLTPAFAEQLSAQALQFLATASPEVLGGLMVGVICVLYFIFGKLVLFIAGVGVGITVHSSWETQRRVGVGESAGLTTFTRNNVDGKKELEGIQQRGRQTSLSILPVETAAAFEELAEAVVRDYVRHWYTALLPDDNTFPDACKEALESTLVNVYYHISQKRPTDALILFLTSTSNTLIVFFRELATALANSGGNISPGAAIGTFVEDNPASALAQLLDQDLQKRKLHLAAEDIIQSFVDRKIFQCSPLRVFLQEILAGMVLRMTIDKCSEADWINQWIIYLLEEQTQPEVLHRIEVAEIGTDGKVIAQVQEEEDLSILDKGKVKEQNEKDRKKEARLSKAEEAMQQAIREAQELTRMIEEEERRKRNGEILKEEPGDNSTGLNSHSVRQLTLVEETRDVTTPLLRSRANSSVQVSQSVQASPRQASPRPAAIQRSFTSFDQIVPPISSTPPPPPLPPPPPPPVVPRDCLHRAHITLADLSPQHTNNSLPGGPMRSKPISTMYMIQVEPHSSYGIPGWIVTRKYADFESLHEVLCRLAIVSGAEYFAIHHSDIPTWRGGVTKEQLRQRLETYLNAAVREQSLAQSEGMKRFLDKDGAMLEESGGTTMPGNPLANLTKNWPKPKFKALGDNVLDALTKAPQEAAQGGKAFFGGVFSNVQNIRRNSGLQNKSNTADVVEERPRPLPMGIYNPPKSSEEHGRVAVVENGWITREEHVDSNVPVRREQSLERKTPRPRNDYFDGAGDFDDWTLRAVPRQEHRKTMDGGESGHRRGRPSQDGIIPPRSSSSGWRNQSRHKMTLSQDVGQVPMPVDLPDDFLDISSSSARRPTLPPRPVTIAEVPVPRSGSLDVNGCSNEIQRVVGIHEDNVVGSTAETIERTQSPPPPPSRSAVPPPIPPKPTTPAPQLSAPLSEQETQLIVEIIFAILSELFTLSSAWLLRRSLLNVAKNILLRPGNTSLEATRLLIQESLLDGTTSDQAIAEHVRKLRQNMFSTKAEIEAWEKQQQVKREWQRQAGRSEEEEKNERRDRARKLLLEKGMPEALRGVMGSAACRECLGRVFDSLQVKSVARGLVCGLVLEVIRGVCQ